MAMLNGGRMVALFLCLLFALNVSFAQELEYETYVLYMVDPVEEELAPAVYDYVEKWNDPLTWETFEDDFTPARQAQVDRVRAENALRVQAAYRILNNREDCEGNGECIKSWVPSWIPLKRAGDLELAHRRDEDDPDENAQNFLFKNILGLTGSEGQTLEEFYDENWNASEPDRESESGVRNCELGERCDQAKRLSSYFQSLVEDQRLGARIISLTFEATRTDSLADPDPEYTDSFVEELETGSTQKPGVDPPLTVTKEVLLKEGSVRLLQSAMHDPNLRVIDDPSDGYFRPAAKPVSSTETSSWGRIKATLAD